MLSIWRELDKTLLFVTHDIEEAVTLADRVFVLSGTPGRVREDARIDLSRVRGRTGDEFVDCVDRLLDIAEPSR